MSAKKISQLNNLNNPTLTGVTAIVENGETYKSSLESIKKTISNAVDITYSELLSLINASGLTPFSYYKISDFATTYWMIDSNGYESNDGVPIVENIEEIYVLATSENTLDTFAHSPSYPNDIIRYDWDESNFVNDVSFYNLPDFKGVITYREDTINNISAGWDIRTVKTRRWESTAPDWSSVENYIYNDIVYAGGYIFKCLQSNTNADPLNPSNDNYWSIFLDLTTTNKWNSNSTAIIFDGITVYSATGYTDFITIDVQNPNVYNIHISPSIYYYEYSGVYSRLSNIVFFGESNNIFVNEGSKILTVGNNVTDVYVNSNCYRMIFGEGSNNITIGSSCKRFIFGNLTENLKISTNCSDILTGRECNYISFSENGNNCSFANGCTSIDIRHNCNFITFGKNCSTMIIKSDSYSINFGSYCGKINIDQNCNNINFGDECRDINISTSCVDITLPDGSNYNSFESNTTGDFSSSTHIIGDYNCKIFRNSGNVVRLSYYDASDVNQVVDINV